MALDLRIPMGLLFSVLGLLLAAYGLFGDQSVYRASLGINVNLWAGPGMLLFGVAMLAGAWHSERKAKPSGSAGQRH